MNLKLCGALALAFFGTQGSAQDIGPGVSRWQAGVICPAEARNLRDASYVAQTRVVPAVRGMAFGVRAQAADPAGVGGVTITVTHPPFVGSGETQASFQTAVPGDGLSGFYYRLDRDAEVVPGEWVFEAEANGVRLYRISFRTYLPPAGDGLIRECGV